MLKYFSEFFLFAKIVPFYPRDTGLNVSIYHLALFTIVQENKGEGSKQLICSSVVNLLSHRSVSSLVPACLHTVPILKLTFDLFYNDKFLNVSILGLTTRLGVYFLARHRLISFHTSTYQSCEQHLSSGR